MPTRHGGILVQSTHGAQGNFEVVTPRLGGGVAHLYRNNDDPTLKWHGPGLAFGSAQDVAAVALVQSNLGPAGNLEAITLEAKSLVYRWRDDGGSWKWQAPTTLPGGLAANGRPGFIQSAHGAKGNFEVIAAVAGGGFAQWWRDNDAPSLTWYGPFVVSGPPLDDVALVQSNFGPLGNLEIIARQGDQLVAYWRDDGASWQWHGPVTFAPGGVAGAPAFIQSSFGSKGHFHVVAPAEGGGLLHWWRDNDDPTLAWHGPTPFGGGAVRAVGLIESNYGNLEVVAFLDDHLEHFFSAPSGPWRGPFPFGALPAPAPAEKGTSSIPYRSGVVAIHAALLYSGHVVVFGFADNDAEVGVSRLLDPATGVLEEPDPTPNAFCSGHTFLPDGRLLVAGGHHHDVASLHVFDPGPRTWTDSGTMDHGRWYPTCTTLPDGRIFIISGNGGGPGAPVNHTFQIFETGAGLGPERPLPTPFSAHEPDTPHIELYPFVYVLPAGGVLVHSRSTTRFCDPASDAWHPVQLKTIWPYSRNWPIAGTSVLLALLPDTQPAYRAHVMIIGGASADPETANTATPATNSVELLDLGDSAPTWKAIEPLTQARVMPDAVLLPDGTVVVLGGSATGRADMAGDPVLGIELFDPFVSGQLDPANGTWKSMVSLHVPRLYHSTALLLPDGSVMIAGKDRLFNPDPFKYPEHRVEIFKPPYFSKGPRPTISVPGTIDYQAPFAIDTPQAGSIASVVLVRPGTVTHSFNMNQRVVGLSIVAKSGSSVTVEGPPTPSVAPPGHYLLFALDEARVPSTGVFVHLV